MIWIKILFFVFPIVGTIKTIKNIIMLHTVEDSDPTISHMTLITAILTAISFIFSVCFALR
jgi:hypothetical protein